MLYFRRPALISMVIVICAVLVGIANADEFPTRPVQIVNMSAPGSGMDIMTRQVAKYSAPFLGKPIVIVTKTGAAGANQQRYMLKEEPGYTLGTIGSATIAWWLLIDSLRKNKDKFEYIAQIQYSNYLSAVKSDSPFNTLKEMVEWAKKHPGKLRVGGFGSAGSGQNISFTLLARAAGIKFTWIPYTGGGKATAALLGGKDIDVLSSNPANVVEFQRAGKLRVIGVHSDKRIEEFPDASTYNEAGYAVDTSYTHFRGFFAKKGVPKDALTKLDYALSNGVNTPGYKKYVDNIGAKHGYLGPKEFSELMSRKVELTTRILKELGKL